MHCRLTNTLNRSHVLPFKTCLQKILSVRFCCLFLSLHALPLRPSKPVAYMRLCHLLVGVELGWEKRISKDRWMEGPKGGDGKGGEGERREGRRDGGRDWGREEGNDWGRKQLSGRGRQAGRNGERGTGGREGGGKEGGRFKDMFLHS